MRLYYQKSKRGYPEKNTEKNTTDVFAKDLAHYFLQAKEVYTPVKTETEITKLARCTLISICHNGLKERIDC